VLFEESTPVEPATLVRLIQRSARELRLEGPQKLRIARALPNEAARFEYAAELLGRLAPAGARARQDG
jgi:transcription-repair coupling factor (superfamily II helicase)